MNKVITAIGLVLMIGLTAAHGLTHDPYGVFCGYGNASFTTNIWTNYQVGNNSQGTITYHSAPAPGVNGWWNETYLNGTTASGTLYTD